MHLELKLLNETLTQSLRSTCSYMYLLIRFAQLTFACSHVVFELRTVDAFYGKGHTEVEVLAFIDSMGTAPCSSN